MLGHTKRRRIKVPKRMVEKTIPWREAAKEEIDQFSETGVMIKGSRYKNNLTQTQLADLLGISQHHISEMENGKRPVGKNMAHRLAAVFHCDYRIFL